MHRLALICLLLALATTAAADSDVLCICADPYSPNQCGGNVDVSVPGQAMITLAILHPTATPILYWETHIETVGGENYIGDWRIDGGVPVISGGDYQVGYSEATALTPNGSDVVVLMTLQLYVLSDGPIVFFVQPVDGSQSFDGTPGYAIAVLDRHPLTSCAGDFEIPAFTINGGGLIDQENWGQVKSLYRH